MLCSFALQNHGAPCIWGSGIELNYICWSLPNSCAGKSAMLVTWGTGTGDTGRSQNWLRMLWREYTEADCRWRLWHQWNSTGCHGCGKCCDSLQQWEKALLPRPVHDWLDFSTPRAFLTMDFYSTTWEQHLDKLQHNVSLLPLLTLSTPQRDKYNKQNLPLSGITVTNNVTERFPCWCEVGAAAVGVSTSPHAQSRKRALRKRAHAQSHTDQASTTPPSFT